MADSELVKYAVTILRPRTEVYARWRNWEDLPHYSRHLKSVRDLGDGTTEWVAEGPNGDVTWQAETITDEVNERIAWRSIEDSDIRHNGLIEFKDAPAEQGTEVVLHMQYDAPGGAIGKFWAKMTGNEPRQEVAETMRRFKSILECGEIPVVEGQSSNRKRGDNQPGEPSAKVGLR